MIIAPNNVNVVVLLVHPSNLPPRPHVFAGIFDVVAVPEQSFDAYLSNCICPLTQVTFCDVVAKTPIQTPGKIFTFDVISPVQSVFFQVVLVIGVQSVLPHISLQLFNVDNSQISFCVDVGLPLQSVVL